MSSASTAYDHDAVPGYLRQPEENDHAWWSEQQLVEGEGQRQNEAAAPVPQTKPRDKWPWAIVGVLAAGIAIFALRSADQWPALAMAEAPTASITAETDQQVFVGPLRYTHCGRDWLQASYEQKLYFCEKLAESLPQLRIDKYWYCRRLNQVFSPKAKKYLDTSLSDMVVIILDSEGYIQ